MRTIGIVDADLIERTKHRFPNLACEKIAAYLKQFYNVKLITKWNQIKEFDKIYISKVFTDTYIPDWVLNQPNIVLGGTGFYFDKAQPLPSEIEHQMPDYHLYDEWISQKISEGVPGKRFSEYQNTALGFLTRGCFRKCNFCVNQKYNQVYVGSPLSEFYDGSQKHICLLDDNFFGYKDWEKLLNELIETNKPFYFRQGLDERLLTDKHCKLLFSSKYYKDFTFAFDNVKDYDIIQRKIELIRKYTSSPRIKFYVLVGFESVGLDDIENAFKRVSLLMQYNCLPYIMRYQGPNSAPWKTSKYRSIYVALARWCNQPYLYRKLSFREFCEMTQLQNKSNKPCTALQGIYDIEHDAPEIAKKYFDLKVGEF